MDETAAYNRRQYKLMLYFISEYEAGNSSLERLVGHLEGLLNALQKVSQEWEETFRSQCNVIGITYDVARYQERELDAADYALITPALSKLRELAQNGLDALPPDEDEIGSLHGN